MDLIAKKLEKFGLDNFVNVYRFYLCSKTVSPNKIAVALNFDADQCAIINHPPDNFSKCEKFYELIQKKSKVRDFLEALDETGNEHIIKFIKEIDFSTASTSTNPNQSQSPRRGIWFNIPEPIDSFCGREDFLNKLHDQLKPRDQDRADSETEVTVLSQVKIVSGLGGIGKTQTARRYITKHRKFYNNFIWVDAETENSMRNSFLKLAEEIKIPLKNSEGNSIEIQEILKEIYNKICEGGKSNLIVFDNAEDFQSLKKFIPLGLHPDLKRMIIILATSRNQEWASTTGKIQVLPLDKMTDDESLEFLLKELEIPESDFEEFKEESREFIQLIGGLPLALQQAVAYIKHQKKVNRLLNRPYKIIDYVLEFNSSAEKLQKFPHAPDSPTTIFIAWNLTLQKIKEDPKGEIAIQIIELMSFLYADKIPVEFLRQLLPLPSPPQTQNQSQSWVKRLHNLFQQQQEDCLQLKELTESDLVEGLTLLEKFSMIKITGNFLSIHRQVQFVLLQNLKNKSGLLNIFNHLIEKCLVILKNIKLSECSDTFLNVHQIANNSFDLQLIPGVTEKFLDFLSEFGLVLWRASRYSESLDLYTRVYSNRCDLLGENHLRSLNAQQGIALQLSKLGRDDEALILYKEILQRKEIHLGVDHSSTIATKQNLASVLYQQGKYEESLQLHEQVLHQSSKVNGEHHRLTLLTQNAIAQVHSQLGNFPKALALYQEVEKKESENIQIGPDHRDVLLTKHNKASVLYEMGKFQEASRILQEVHEKRKEILGENHLETIDTLSWIAVILEREGKLTVREALDFFNKVYEIRRINLGEDHPQTIDVKSKILLFENKLGEQNTTK